jgi:hypothetical protein
LGLGLKLWLLLSVQAPYTTSRIWLGAAGQGVSLTIAAVQAAVAYALHAVQLLLQCSGLLLAHTGLQLPAAGASALAAAGSAVSNTFSLVKQLTGVWWRTIGASAAAAGTSLLQATAEALPGGTLLLQLLTKTAAFCTYAASSAAAAMQRSWRFFAAADEEDWRGISVHSIAVQMLGYAAAGLGWIGLQALSTAEMIAVLVTTRALPGAHPMAQAAVWGSAGMLKRLVVEASQQSWMLLVQLYGAWRQQQQLQQQ